MRNLSTKKKLLLTVERIAELLETLVESPLPEDRPALDKDLHVTAEWIIDFLQIHRSNFYRNVHNKLIKPVLYVGRRPYYLKQDVEKLLQHHEPGAHTFHKLVGRKPTQKSRLSDQK